MRFLRRSGFIMTPQEIDFIFPFVVLAYGVLVSCVLHTPYLMDLAEDRLPAEVLRQMQGHRILALICLGVGGLWSLQNIWQ